jgi:predicted acylesterase/phospholipase RssA
VFRNSELTPDVLLASACLPTMFQAVEIDGEHYWDGGYSGNPTMTPLVRECTSSDTILVPINPVERPGVPRSARDILDRLNEVLLQCGVAQGASHDRPAAAGRAARRDRRREMGGDADSHGPTRRWSISAIRRSSTPNGSF